MDNVIGIYQVKVKEGTDIRAFENCMKTEVFPTVKVGHQTRGGIVTAQYLIKEAFLNLEHNYSWIVHWTNMGGSPFGATGAPTDPMGLLAEFGAETSFVKHVVLEQETMEPKL